MKRRSIIAIFTLFALIFGAVMPVMAQDAIVSPADGQFVVSSTMFIITLGFSLIAMIGVGFGAYGVGQFRAMLKMQRENVSSMTKMEEFYNSADKRTQGFFSFAGTMMKFLALSLPSDELKALFGDASEFINEITDDIPIADKQVTDPLS